MWVKSTGGEWLHAGVHLKFYITVSSQLSKELGFYGNCSPVHVVALITTYPIILQRWEHAFCDSLYHAAAVGLHTEM